MAQLELNKCSGLHSLSNQLMLPAGALLKALNVVINRDNIIESRRGFKLYGNSFGSSLDRAKQLIVYKERLLRHFASSLQWDDGNGTFTSFSGSYAEPTTGTKIKSIEANGNLYFTTSDGIKKLSVSSASDLGSTSITNAGGIKALDGEATLNTTQGFFTQDSSVAYRAVWGIKDANNNIILGTPSQRIILVNSIISLMISDFNSLLLELDRASAASSSDLLSDNNYISLKLENNASTNLLKSNLENLATKLDDDMIVTEQVQTASISVTSNIASLTFNADVSDFLEIGDYIDLSGFTLNSDYTDMHGKHRITSVSTTMVTFNINHADFVVGAGDVGGVVKRLKYTLSPFRAVSTTELDIASVGVEIKNQLAYITFASDVSNQIKVGDDIQLSGFTSTGIELVNGSYTVRGIQKKTNANDTIQIQLITSNVVYTPDTGGKLTLIESERNLTVSSPSTTEQNERIQAYFNDIVTDLLLEPSGIIDPATSFNPQNATTSATVDVSLTIPQEITAAHFIQLYRSPLQTSVGASVLDDLDTPSDEMNLVYEANPTSSELSSRTMTIHDIVPEDFRAGGAPLYTNPNSGEGIAQANDIPPLAKDVASFKNYTFYANTQTKHRKIFSLLGVANLSSGSSSITIGNATTQRTYTFVSPVAEKTTIQTVADSSDSLAGTYFTLNSGKNKKSYYVWYKVSGNGSDPAISGKTGIMVEISTNDTANDVATATRDKLNEYNDFIITGTTNNVIIENFEAGISDNITDVSTGFTIMLNTSGAGEDSSTNSVLLSDLPTPSQQVDETARSLIRVINKDSSSIVNAYYLSGVNDVPGKILLEAKNLSDSKFYLIADNSTSGQQFDPDLSPKIVSNISVANPTVLTSTNHGLVTGQSVLILNSDSTPTINGVKTVTKINSNTFSIPVNVTVGGSTAKIATEMSDNEVKPNRIYYSKVQQPEAVPLLNYFPVGPEDKEILRIVALRDSLFIFKEEAIYRLSGETAPFTVTLFDSSTQLVAPASLSVLNNQIYGFSNQGVIAVSDTGVDIISRQIENRLLKLILPKYTSFKSATWGVAYETDRSYYLFTVTSTTDTVATQCFRFNTFTRTWTELGLSKTIGIVGADDKLYLGAGDTNYLEQERKNFNRTDYADREFQLNITFGSVNRNEIIFGSVANIAVGDVIVQEQTVTLYQYHRLLLKLDLEDNLSGDYYQSLRAVPGEDLRIKLDLLAEKLDTDIGGTDYIDAITPFGSSFADIQDAFNAIVAILNTETVTKYSNYPTSTGTVIQEMDITNIEVVYKKVYTRDAYPFIVGPVTIYKYIPKEIEWAPQTAGNPSLYKHFREGTLMFENTNFSRATFEFASDLSPNYDEIEFEEDGPGIFGSGKFGETVFGGLGTSTPFRTHVPRNKQRCRHLLLKFTHATARENPLVYGYSLTFEPYQPSGERAYR